MNEKKIRKAFNRHKPDKENIRAEILSKISESNVVRRRGGWKTALIALIITVMLVGSVGGYAVAAEAKEYKAAVEFFNTYNLSTEELTRSEIKAVYKDISTKTYSYTKTLELMNEISVEMYSTELEGADRDTLEALWNSRNNYIYGKQTSESISGVRYEIKTDTVERENEISLDFSTIIRYENDKEVWRYTAPESMYIDPDRNIIMRDDGIIAYGRKGNVGTSTGYAYAFMLDTNGKLKWEYTDSVKGSEFQAATVTANGIALFGSEIGRVNENLCRNQLTVLSLDGNLISRNIIECTGYTWYQTAVGINDYYLVKQYASKEGYSSLQPELVSYSSDGKLLNKFTYSENGEEYLIQDITFYEGKVYLSALLPTITDADFTNSFEKLMVEYYEKWNEASSGNKTGESSVTMSDKYNTKLNELFKEQYTAVLLVCDEKAVITKAYSVKDARAGTLSVDENGKLSWQIIRIDDVKNAAPYISSRSVDILGSEFSFMFDAEGKLIEKREVGVYPMMY